MRTQPSNGAEKVAADKDKNEARVAKFKAEAYDLIRLIEQAKLRLAEVNRAIAEVEK